MATSSAILTWTLAALFVLHIQTALACPTINDTIRRHEYNRHLKRWYSWGNPSAGEPETRTAWPLIIDPNDPSVPDGIDPRTDAFQPIRYCWEDQAAYNALNVFFSAAAAKWDNAMQYSALCTDYDFATQLGFSGIQHMPDPEDYELSLPQHSYTYDLDSLMHYGSFQGATVSQDNFLNTDFPDKAVLLKAIPGMTKQSKYGQMIWFGGNQDPAQIVISEGDIARVAQLYPDVDKDGPGYRTATTWAGTSLAWKAKRTAMPESGNGMPA